MEDNTKIPNPILVVGASRGLGRAVAARLAQDGHRVLAMARDADALRSLAAEHGNITPVVGDATDPTTATRVMGTHRPRSLVLVAGAQPTMRPLRDYDWDRFQAPFQTDTRLTFEFLRECLLRPMAPGGRVVVFSSGAALGGSPLSGGYASAKQAQRYLVQYARSEADKREMSLHFHTLLPQLNPNTELGRAGIAGYAAASGETPEAFVQKRFPNPLTQAVAADAVAAVLGGQFDGTAELMLDGRGATAL